MFVCLFNCVFLIQKWQLKLQLFISWRCWWQLFLPKNLRGWDNRFLFVVIYRFYSLDLFFFAYSLSPLIGRVYYAFFQIQVDVYYESMCPDSIKFINTQLHPALATVGSNISQYVQLQLIPFGKSSVSGRRRQSGVFYKQKWRHAVVDLYTAQCIERSVIEALFCLSLNVQEALLPYR